jgi:DnaJ-class molecular chaperone
MEDRDMTKTTTGTGAFTFGVMSNGLRRWAVLLVTCGRCNGKGKLSAYSNVRGGVCFNCGGAGRVEMPERFATRIWKSLDRHVRAIA